MVEDRWSAEGAGIALAAFACLKYTLDDVDRDLATKSADYGTSARPSLKASMEPYFERAMRELTIAIKTLGEDTPQYVALLQSSIERTEQLLALKRNLDDLRTAQATVTDYEAHR